MATNIRALACLKGGKWAPERTGVYEDDNRVGRALALELDDLMQQTGNPALFGTVVRAITINGVFEAVEIGFCSHFGIRLVGL